MSNSTCTIITANYLHYALALNSSLKQFRQDPFYVLVVDQEIVNATEIANEDNVHFLYLKDVNNSELSNKIIEKYSGIDDDALRWSMKSILIKHLLEKFEGVLCLDCDLYFYEDYSFLFDELIENNVILTPHWRNSDPGIANKNEQFNFELLYKEGLFNAGFIGCNQKSKPFLEWWAQCCLANCIKNPNKGFYVDQAYLNLAPIYFPKVKILQNRGCNISYWNKLECKRVIIPSGEILINGEYPIVFIHFVNPLIKDIEANNDPLLVHHLLAWQKKIIQFEKYSAPYLKNEIKVELQNSQTESLLYSIKRKLRIRTRIKKFIEG